MSPVGQITPRRDWYLMMKRFWIFFWNLEIDGCVLTSDISSIHPVSQVYLKITLLILDKEIPKGLEVISCVCAYETQISSSSGVSVLLGLDEYMDLNTNLLENNCRSFIVSNLSLWFKFLSPKNMDDSSSW